MHILANFNADVIKIWNFYDFYLVQLGVIQKVRNARGGGWVNTKSLRLLFFYCYKTIEMRYKRGWVGQKVIILALRTFWTNPKWWGLFFLRHPV